jgi:hypothetical protein
MKTGERTIRNRVRKLGIFIVPTSYGIASAQSTSDSDAVIREGKTALIVGRKIRGDQGDGGIGQFGAPAVFVN